MKILGIATYLTLLCGSLFAADPIFNLKCEFEGLDDGKVKLIATATINLETNHVKGTCTEVFVAGPDKGKLRRHSTDEGYLLRTHNINNTGSYPQEYTKFTHDAQRSFIRFERLEDDRVYVTAHLTSCSCYKQVETDLLEQIFRR